jgi:predicted Holliday junction resolvase-like endonuclease
MIYFVIFVLVLIIACLVITIREANKQLDDQEGKICELNQWKHSAGKDLHTTKKYLEQVLKENMVLTEDNKGYERDTRALQSDLSSEITARQAAQAAAKYQLDITRYWRTQCNRSRKQQGKKPLNGPKWARKL